jgi:hypothetical protein
MKDFCIAIFVTSGIESNEIILLPCHSKYHSFILCNRGTDRETVIVTVTVIAE